MADIPRPPTPEELSNIARLKAEMQKLGIENVKTAVGTAYTTTTESVTVADQEVFFNYVKDNEAWELMEKRASKSAVLAVMGERDESGSRPDAPPPGISFYAVKSINVRR